MDEAGILLSRHLQSCNKMSGPQRDLPEAPERKCTMGREETMCLGVGVDKGSAEVVVFWCVLSKK